MSLFGNCGAFANTRSVFHHNKEQFSGSKVCKNYSKCHVRHLWRVCKHALGHQRASRAAAPVKNNLQTFQPTMSTKTTNFSNPRRWRATRPHVAPLARPNFPPCGIAPHGARAHVSREARVAGGRARQKQITNVSTHDVDQNNQFFESASMARNATARRAISTPKFPTVRHRTARH
jgi:hypothetical protein